MIYALGIDPGEINSGFGLVQADDRRGFPRLILSGQCKATLREIRDVVGIVQTELVDMSPLVIMEKPMGRWAQAKQSHGSSVKEAYGVWKAVVDDEGWDLTPVNVKTWRSSMLKACGWTPRTRAHKSKKMAVMLADRVYRLRLKLKQSHTAEAIWMACYRVQCEREKQMILGGVR